MIAGAPSHGYGSHEHYAGLKVLEDALKSSSDNVDVQVVRGWPEDSQLIDKADTIVIYSDGGGGHTAIPHLQQLKSRLAQGAGLVCLHYAVEMVPGEPGDTWVQWLGGHFEIHWSVNPHWVANFDSLPEHPITHGVKPFATNDEWYFHLRFNPSDQVQPILSAVAPPETMRREDGPHSGNPDVRKSVARGDRQTVAWAFQRPDGGRSFGFTGGHFHWNWGHDDVRRLVTNAILWTAGEEVSATGAKMAGGVGIENLLENQDFDPPKNFDPQQIKTEFNLQSSTSPRSAIQSATTKTGRELFRSPLVTSENGGKVQIDVPLGGATELYLVVTDGGNGFACDWADWIDATIHGKKGSKPLTELDWISATSEFGAPTRNANCVGQPWSVAGTSLGTTCIGTHANSVIRYRLPKGYNRFTATGALDTGGTSQAGGRETSVQFVVFADAIPAGSIAGGKLPEQEQRDAANAVSGLEVAEGLEVTLAASEPALKSLTNLDIDDRGRVWVCDVMNYRHNNNSRPEGDRILILEDITGDGVMDSVKTYYQGRDIDSAMGICVLGNEVIVSATPNIWRFVDDNGDDIPDRKEAIFTETGQPQHDHSAHSFIFGPDGKLYWNFGNTGQQVKDAEGKTVIDVHGRPVVDNGQPFFGGMPFRCDLDGSNFEVLAHNFRNNYETTVDSFGTLWQSDNDDDGNRGTRINFVMEHGNYGYSDEMTGAGWRDDRITIEEEIPLRHWHLNDPGVIPNLLQTGAGSPSGICLYEGRLLPERFWNQIIHCDPGPNVVRAYPVKPDGAGYSATIEPLVTGTGDQWFRPADVCAAPDGSLFVTDWYDPGVGGHRQGDIERGRLFRIAPPGTPYKIPSLDYSTPEGAIEALRNPNLAARYKAWVALRSMNEKAEPALLQMYNEETDPRLRARALWLLGRLNGHGSHYVTTALSDKDADIRCTAIRLARQLGMSPSIACVKAATDSSPSVRRELAVSLRFDDSPTMPAVWAKLAQQYDGKDRWYLEALGLASDLRAAECYDAWTAAVNGSSNTPAGRDIVWRVRAPKATEALISIISDPKLPLEGTNRYFRSLEYHKPEVRTEAMKKLLTLAVTEGGDALRARNDAIIVRAIERMSNYDASGDPQVQAAINRHLDRVAGTAEYLSLVKRFRPADSSQQLQAMLAGDLSDSLKVEAANLLCGLPDGPERLTQSLRVPEVAVAAQVASILGSLGNDKARDLIAEVAKDAQQPFDVRRNAVAGLAKNVPGQNLILKLARSGELAADTRLLAGGLLARSENEQVRKRAAELLPPPQQKDQQPMAPIDELAAMRGDAANGLQLFRGTATCANCHIIDKFGKEVGPDLSEIGSKLTREAMYTSILDPNAGISHNYETFIVLTDSGQTITGLKMSETSEEVTIRNAEGIDRKISTSEIEEIQKGLKSVMPENLHHLIDQKGLVDIVEYMATLTKK
jgi:putative membrane-bound dehydrogenase-like protein